MPTDTKQQTPPVSFDETSPAGFSAHLLESQRGYEALPKAARAAADAILNTWKSPEDAEGEEP